MNSKETSELVVIRDWASRALDNLMVKMSNDEVKKLSAKIAKLDRQILEAVLDEQAPAAPQMEMEMAMATVVVDETGVKLSSPKKKIQIKSSISS